jgi:hypothetical protein
LQAGIGLPAGLGLAGGKARITRSLLLSCKSNLPLYLFGSLSGDFGLRTLLCCKSFRLTLGFRSTTGCFSHGGPRLSCLNESLPLGLPCEDSRVIRCGACPKPIKSDLPRFGGLLKTIDKLDCFELTHVHSLCAPQLSFGGEKQMKPLPRERLRSS